MIIYMTMIRCLRIIFKKRVRNQHRFSTTAMTSMLVPPASVRGMTCLNREAFATVVDVPYVKIQGATVRTLMPILKKYLFRFRQFQPILKTENGFQVHLNPERIKKFEDIAETDRVHLTCYYAEFGTSRITMRYQNWPAKDLLKAILPEGFEVPASYSIIGHIVHINLRDAYLPYKAIIGQILLDTIPFAKTVVNKINNIDSPYRELSMEVIAGEENTITVAKENGVLFEMDFSKVYWNSRLSTEHIRLVTPMKCFDVLYDVFAGIGPFAIPAAAKGVQVFANDLNPESYKWLQKNVIINKVTDHLKCFNLDGRDFIRNVVKPDILKRRANSEIGSEHIVMNLPAIAVEFLDVFFDGFNQDEIERMCCVPPIVHLYCFVKVNKSEDACKFGRLLVEEKLGCALDSNSLVGLFNVRNVSPNKEMIRVSFLLTENILKGEGPAMKRLRVENNPAVSVNDNITENNGKEQRLTENSKEQECFQSRKSS